jgi:peptidoglycan/xylan/chitin deacetylase (PgdA/CDA1 family)
MLHYTNIKKAFLVIGLLIMTSFVFVGCSNKTEVLNVDNFDDLKDVEEVKQVEIESEIEMINIDEDFELPILCIHHVGKAPSHLSKSARDWYISIEKFESILKYLKEEGYVTLFASELYEYIEQGKLPNNAIVLTFDDGAVDFYDNVYPLLQKYDMKAVMHLMSGVKSSAWLNVEQIQEMNKSNVVEFQSHTQYHEYLTRISDEDVRRELENSKKQIEKITEKSVIAIGYPFGLYDDRIIRIAKDVGYKMGFTIDRKLDQKMSELFKLHRIIVMEYTDIEKVIH